MRVGLLVIVTLTTQASTMDHARRFTGHGYINYTSIDYEPRE